MTLYHIIFKVTRDRASDVRGGGGGEFSAVRGRIGGASAELEEGEQGSLSPRPPLGASSAKYITRPLRGKASPPRNSSIIHRRGGVVTIGWELKGWGGNRRVGRRGGWVGGRRTENSEQRAL